MHKLRRLILASSWLLGGTAGSNVHGLDESRLWLAHSHSKYHIRLVRAAKTVEIMDRCQEVIEGTLDTAQSRSEKPMFRILCRQRNGKSYNEMVDGMTFEVITRPKPVARESSSGQLQLSAVELRERAEQRRRARTLWQLCDKAIRNRSKLMMEFKWASPSAPKPLSIDAGSAVFEAYFDAKDIWGQGLFYKANCKVEADKVVQLLITKK